MNLLIILILASLILLSTTAEQYPQEALQCYASSALEVQKDGIIICPRGSSVCIKEVVSHSCLCRCFLVNDHSLTLFQINTTSRASCVSVEGSPYFDHDIWDRKLAQCVYRKCASRCPTKEEDREKIFDEDDDRFNRTSYCCDTNLCNSTDRKLCGWGLVILLLVILSIHLTL